MALAYAAVFATLILVSVVTVGDELRAPPPPPALALPALPKRVSLALTFVGPCALAGGVVLAPSRWWVGMAGGVGLGALSGAALYLSAERHLELSPVLAPLNWMLAGCLGAVIGQWRRELQAVPRRAQPATVPEPNPRCT
jgi:hypothetical protein